MNKIVITVSSWFLKNLEVIEEVLEDNISIFSGKNRQVGGADLVCTHNPKIMSFEVFGGRPHFFLTG